VNALSIVHGCCVREAHRQPELGPDEQLAFDTDTQ
jgi:hypothetical protein